MAPCLELGMYIIALTATGRVGCGAGDHYLAGPVVPHNCQVLPLLCACRSQLWYLSCHGCMLMGDEVCDGLNSCVVLDMAQTPLSDAGLQNLLDGVRRT